MKLPKELIDAQDKTRLVIPQEEADKLGIGRKVSLKELKDAIAKMNQPKPKKEKKAEKVQTMEVEPKEDINL